MDPFVPYGIRQPPITDNQWQYLNEANFVCDAYQYKVADRRARKDRRGVRFDLDDENLFLDLQVSRLTRSADRKIEFVVASGIYPNANHPPIPLNHSRKIEAVHVATTALSREKREKLERRENQERRKLEEMKKWAQRNPKSERTPIPGHTPLEKKRLVSTAMDIARKTISTTQAWFTHRPSSPPVDINITKAMAAMDVAGNPNDSFKQREEYRQKKLEKKMKEQRMWDQINAERIAEEERQETERIHYLERRRQAKAKADMFVARGNSAYTRPRWHDDRDEVFEMNL